MQIVRLSIRQNRGVLDDIRRSFACLGVIFASRTRRAIDGYAVANSTSGGRSAKIP